MDSNKLPPNTRQLWERLQSEPLLKGFVLIGGTALALRIGHRISEDLDFAYLGETLPKARLKSLIRLLKQEGIILELNQDPIAEEEFFDSGLELDKFHQNYFSDGHVKVTFVRLENEVTDLFLSDINSPLRVATLDEIFNTKALVCSQRTKSRDWLDLYVLINFHGYTIADMYRTYESIGRSSGFDNASMRLRVCKELKEDEGYEQLVDPAPTLEDLRTFFNQRLDEFEAEQARRAFKSLSAAQSLSASSCGSMIIVGLLTEVELQLEIQSRVFRHLHAAIEEPSESFYLGEESREELGESGGM